jgi:hypothetical protein
MSINFKYSKEDNPIPIAIVNDPSGVMSAKILFLYEDGLNDNGPKRETTIEDLANEMLKLLGRPIVPTDKVEQNKEINLTGKAKFSLVPEQIDKQRAVLSLFGPSGVGKSYLAAEYAKNFHALFPSRKIYLFTKKDKDPNFDNHNYIKRVDLICLLEAKINIDELENSLVIMDDYETLDGELRTEFYRLKNDILLMGRSLNIAVLMINHVMAAGMDTKLDNIETTAYVLYKNGSDKHNRYILTTYVGLKKEIIDKILSLPSRWIYINRKYPRHVITQNQAFLLD